MVLNVKWTFSTFFPQIHHNNIYVLTYLTGQKKPEFCSISNIPVWPSSFKETVVANSTEADISSVSPLSKEKCLGLTLKMSIFHSIIAIYLILFSQAGINKGYQEKPCLDPTEAKCPQTAPNSPRNTGRVRHY